MINVFAVSPQGIQPAPHDIRVLAAGYQIAVREVKLDQVRDKEALMLAFLAGLGLNQAFGRNWDALYDSLTDPEQISDRFALVLTDYYHFKRKNGRLSRELEEILINAQTEAAQQERLLWLLANESDLLPG